MDFEAIQLLNLSPIPELSEIELSTMLEQLSNLSDLNGDLTDRNVEDILKEAEDLLDKSTSSRYTEPKISSASAISLPEKTEVIEKKFENNTPEVGGSDNVVKEEPADDEKICKTPEKKPNKSTENPLNESSKKCLNESNEKQSPPNDFNKLFTPRFNHIRSAIDALREYSSLMEKQISQSQQSSPRSKKENIKVNINLRSENDNIEETPRSIPRSPIKKKTEPLNMKQSIKLINCFERLYQNTKPVHKKVKPANKVVAKKNQQKDLKDSTSKEKKQINKKIDDGRASEEASNCRQGMPNKKDERDIEDWIKQTNRAFTYPIPYKVPLPFEKLSQESSESDSMKKNKSPYTAGCSSSPLLFHKNLDEQLVRKLVQEIEDIKNHVKISGMCSKSQNPEKILKDSQSIINRLRSEVESARRKASSEESENAAIKRLEQQLAQLKEKYDRQMEKLENENLKLRETLQNRQKTSQPPNENTDEIPVFMSVNQNTTPTPNESTPSPRKFISRCTSFENFQVPSNTPSTPPEDSLKRTPPKEAFSQTEKELRNTSTQCEEEEEEKQENIFKIENKENISQKKKVGKPKPFSDLYQFVKQKKSITEHETQLLATLRGLQSELSEKNKEVRKLKNESDVLKNQMKRLGRNKVEGVKKCSSIGTQTIALGPPVQIPYNPQLYEVPNEYQKENEELKARVRTLEENFEMLKEKRVMDLQSLHKVHEEEMAKLVSKLETQSALTKHLHSLLVNR